MGHGLWKREKVCFYEILRFKVVLGGCRIGVWRAPLSSDEKMVKMYGEKKKKGARGYPDRGTTCPPSKELMARTNASIE